MYLSIDTNAKTVKGQRKGYLTGVLYLAPYRESSVMNVCPHATPGCAATCLFTAGRGVFNYVREARIKRTRAFQSNPKFFVDALVKDITSLVRKAKRRKLIPVVRLNGTSDLPWEIIKGSNGRTLMEMFPGVQFYDYTKIYERIVRFADCNDTEFPVNYHLTFSRSEKNFERSEFILEPPTWSNVAVVFAVKRGQALPKHWGGYPVLDGDVNDLRFLDPKGYIVGLRAKGKAKKDMTGFVVREY